MLTKEHILLALRAWVNQRPGLEFANYGDLSSYRSELRSITKDRRDALELLSAVALRDSISAEDLLAAFRAYSGRLSITEKNGKAQLDYCTGQYWPTEYRKAACAVLASALWERKRQDMPKPDCHVTRQFGDNHPDTGSYELYDGLRAGDWIRRSFRREFGRSIQSRWFS